MCTLLAVVPSAGGVLQVAANRDEFLSRPSAPPRVWPGTPAVLAPLDEQAGGTWLGVNGKGLLVAVTNRHGSGRTEGRASRGQLVAQALRADSVQAVHRGLAALEPDVYNPFHLLYADAYGQAGLTFSDGRRVRQRWLEPGLHVLTEQSLGAGEDGSRARAARQALEGGPLPLEAWAAVLALHADADPRQGTCLHAPAFGYGTRSAFLLELSPDAAASRCAWTEGPPCTSPWVDGTALLRDVLGC